MEQDKDNYKFRDDFERRLMKKYNDRLELAVVVIIVIVVIYFILRLFELG